jgi:hypothetical protein
MSPEAVWIIIFLIFLISPFVLLILWLRSRSRLKKCSVKREELETRFTSVLDIEKETEKASEERDRIEKQIDELRSSYRDKKGVYDTLALKLLSSMKSWLWLNWAFTAPIGFVAQIGLRPISPLPQTDLAYSHGTWDAKRCEAV